MSHHCQIIRFRGGLELGSCGEPAVVKWSWGDKLLYLCPHHDEKVQRISGSHGTRERLPYYGFDPEVLDIHVEHGRDDDDQSVSIKVAHREVDAQAQATAEECRPGEEDRLIDIACERLREKMYGAR